MPFSGPKKLLVFHVVLNLFLQARDKSMGPVSKNAIVCGVRARNGKMSVRDVEGVLEELKGKGVVSVVWLERVHCLDYRVAPEKAQVFVSGLYDEAFLNLRRNQAELEAFLRELLREPEKEKVALNG